MIAGVLRSNRVQYTINDTGNQNLRGYEGILALMLEIGGLLGDFAFVPMDLAFNTSSQKFESITVYTGYVGLEHDWSGQFTSSV